MIPLQKTVTYNYIYQSSYTYDAFPTLAVATVNMELEEPRLLQLYSYYIQEQKKLVGNGKEETTIITYEQRYKIMCEFLICTQRTNAFPKEIGIRIIREFEVWLRSSKGYTNDYAMKNIQLLGTVMDIALEEGNITFNPVRQLYKFHYDRKYCDVYLEMDELITLARLPLAQACLDRVRDKALFCCYTGLSHADLMEFRRSKHLILGPNDKPWIYLKRKKNTDKTDEDTFLPLIPAAEALLNKYGGESFPKLHIDNFNSYIKEICAIAGISKAEKVSSKVFRKTFGMLLLNDYAVPLETVSKMLGHGSIRTTERWYAKVRMKKVMRDMCDAETYFVGVEEEVKLLEESVKSNAA